MRRRQSAVASGLPSWVSRELLTFLCLPLLGDVFSVQTVISVFDCMGVGGSGLGLVQTLPMVMLFLEGQPVSLLHQHLVSKPLQASPIQRWLRDTLLQFQAYMASDVEEEEEDTERGGVREGEGEGHVSTTRHYRATSKKKALMRLLTDVIASRAMPLSDPDPELEPESEGGSGGGGCGRVSEMEVDLQIKQTAVPSLDEVVRYLFRPAWLLARRSHHLEVSFMLVALVLEVLESISEQLERRTFGEMTLRGTIHAWHIVAKQLRVCLLISSRTGGRVSVELLGAGEVALYTLLATDTLCFAMQPTQAVEHELRCQEVYSRRAGAAAGRGVSKEEGISAGAGASASGSSSSSGREKQQSSDGGSAGKASGGALLAWGSSADSRWRELVGIADMEDLVLQETTPAATGTGTGGGGGLSLELLQLTQQLSLVLTAAVATVPLASAFSSSSSLSAPPSPGSPSPLHAPLPLAYKNSPPTATVTPVTSGTQSPHSPHTRAHRKTSSTSGKEIKKVRRRRPLLLFFPTHNQPVPLAAYRACALADRWRKRPKRLEILSLAGAHLFPLPPVTRAAVSCHILVTVVFPLLREFLQIEERGGMGRSGLSAALSQPQLQTYAPLSKSKTSSSSSSFSGDVQVQELVVVLADTDLAEQFVHACLELLTATLLSSDDLAPPFIPSSKGELSSKANTSPATRSRAPSVSASAGTRHRSNTTTSTGSACHNAYNYMSPLAFKDESNDLTDWPDIQDTKLTLLVRQFRAQGGCSVEAVRQNMALLWVLQLRAQCGLRGVKLSELYGSSMLSAFMTESSLDCAGGQGHTTSSSSSTSVSELSFSAQLHLQQTQLEALKLDSEQGVAREKKVATTVAAAVTGADAGAGEGVAQCAHRQHLREEFLMQCLRRLEARPSTLVYNIADIWGFEGRAMRLGHLQIMLQLGLDEVAEVLIGQIDAPSSVMDCVTQGVRHRVVSSEASKEGRKE